MVVGTTQPTQPKELFNLRHSSLRVTVERAFGALKSHFRMIDSKLFHPFKTQVKLVLAGCVLHNWIIGHGVDEVVPAEFSWVPNNNGSQPLGTQVDDNATWALLGMNGLITCRLIGVPLTSRNFVSMLKFSVY